MRKPPVTLSITHTSGSELDAEWETGEAGEASHLTVSPGERSLFRSRSPPRLATLIGWAESVRS